MSYTTTFSGTNVTASTKPVTPTSVGPVTNYAVLSDEPTQVVTDNKTCPLSKGEKITYMYSDLKKVSTTLDIQNPAPVQTGVQYVVKIEAIATTTSTTDATYRVDEPVVAYLTVRHQKSGNITNDMVAQLVNRMLGAARTEAGEWRFNDLMRGSLRPTAN